MRIVAVCLLGVVVAMCGPAVADAKKNMKRPSACQRLDKRFKDVAPSRKLVLVRRGNKEFGGIQACVLPRGKVRWLAAWDDEYARDSARVVDSAGTWVLIQETADAEYGSGSTLTRIEVRHSKTLALSSVGFPPTYLCPECRPQGTDFDEAGLAPSGAGAYELIDHDAGGTTTLQAFNAAGALTKLADGAVDGLRVTSKQISWTQAGVAHAAPLN